MKKLLHIIICVVLLCACNNGKKQAEIARQQAYDDSIAEVKKQAEQKKLDSLADYAIGDIRFGMSSEEIKASNIMMNCNIKEEDAYGYHSKYSSSIDGLGYITFELDHDRLHCVYIKSRGEFYSTRGDMSLIINSIERYKQLFSEKYGNPIMLHKVPEPDEFLSLPRIYEICYWTVGNKNIRICIEKQDDYFQAMTEIENNQYVIDFWREDVRNIEEELEQLEKDNRKKDSAIIEIL